MIYHAYMRDLIVQHSTVECNLGSRAEGRRRVELHLYHAVAVRWHRERFAIKSKLYPGKTVNGVPHDAHVPVYASLDECQ
jgi:hypothetical protein